MRSNVVGDNRGAGAIAVVTSRTDVGDQPESKGDVYCVSIVQHDGKARCRWPVWWQEVRGRMVCQTFGLVLGTRCRRYGSDKCEQCS